MSTTYSLGIFVFLSIVIGLCVSAPQFGYGAYENGGGFSGSGIGGSGIGGGIGGGYGNVQADLSAQGISGPGFAAGSLNGAIDANLGGYGAGLQI